MDTVDRLTLDSLHFWFGENQILKGTYLEVLPGRVCGLFGRNGCGKTTALRIAAGQLTPPSGSISIDDERFQSPRRRERFRNIAYLPQVSMLPDSLPVRRVAGVIGAFRGLEDHAAWRSAVGARVGQLSGGQRRLVEFLLVLSLGRRYVLLDEPFTGVEPIIVELMKQIIKESAASGTGLLLTDHECEDVVDVAQDAYVMTDGVCHRLDPSAAIQDELWRYGYL